MISSLSAHDFVKFSASFPVIDVRTPAEFKKGHIPGAFNVPLFSDEERVIIGTAYKHQGKEQAIVLGLEFVGPQMKHLIDQVKDIAACTNSQTFLLHCWRGGMRSASFAWLLQLFGYRVMLLKGGYKAFRAYTQAIYTLPRNIIILGGPTGSGKTEILHMLAGSEQVIDLEKLACHKGSVFGGLGYSEQATQEQFENDLAYAWFNADNSRPVWIEDESRKIGSILIPEPIWIVMRRAPVIYISIPQQQRIESLCKEYGTFTTQELVDCVVRLHRHLGGQRTQEIITALQEGKRDQVCTSLLNYYDKNYAYGLSKRSENLVKHCVLQSAGCVEQVDEIKRFVAEHHVHFC